MDYNKFFQSKKFKIVLAGIGGLVILLLIFQAGAMVGFRKANFSFKWGENYHRNFGGPKASLFEKFRGDDFISGHGVAGQIIKIESVSATSTKNGILAVEDTIFIIKDQAGVEKAVLVKEDTPVKRFRENIQLSELKIDEFVVIIGDPNDAGQIQAKLIRVLPAPGDGMPIPPMMQPGGTPR